MIDRRWLILIPALVIGGCDESRPSEEAATPGEDQAPGSRENGAPPGGAPPNEVDSSSGDAQQMPARKDKMSWNFSRSAAGPKLVYGEPQTDNVRLMLRCPETGFVRLSFLQSPGRTAVDRLTVAAAGAEATAEASNEQSQLGGTMVSADLPIGAEPLRQFRDGSGIRVSWSAGEIDLPSAGSEAQRLFDACA